MGGWSPVSIDILMRGVVPFVSHLQQKKYLFASNSFSRSILICLSIGASWSSGFLYLTKSCCGPISFMTGKYSPFFNKLLSSILSVFSFVVGIWYKSFTTCFSSVYLPPLSHVPCHRWLSCVLCKSCHLGMFWACPLLDYCWSWHVSWMYLS